MLVMAAVPPGRLGRCCAVGRRGSADASCASARQTVCDRAQRSQARKPQTTDDGTQAQTCLSGCGAAGLAAAMRDEVWAGVRRSFGSEWSWPRQAASRQRQGWTAEPRKEGHRRRRLAQSLVGNVHERNRSRRSGGSGIRAMDGNMRDGLPRHVTKWLQDPSAEAPSAWETVGAICLIQCTAFDIEAHNAVETTRASGLFEYEASSTHGGYVLMASCPAARRPLTSWLAQVVY